MGIGSVGVLSVLELLSSTNKPNVNKWTKPQIRDVSAYSQPNWHNISLKLSCLHLQCSFFVRSFVCLFFSKDFSPAKQVSWTWTGAISEIKAQIGTDRCLKFELCGWDQWIEQFSKVKYLDRFTLYTLWNVIRVIFFLNCFVIIIKWRAQLNERINK